ncbi:MAG: CFI-box-CTERM domain-containing protein [Bdellovibrionia bacterium]
MPSKWERCYLRICSQLNKLGLPAYLASSFQNHAYAVACMALLLLFSAPANAEIEITPNNGGSLGGSPAYYFVKFPNSIAVAPPAFLPSGVVPLDITESAYSGDETTNGFANRFEINFRSDVTPPVLTGTQQIVVTFQAYPTTTSPIHPAPIATVNGKACDPSICQGLNAIGTGNHYYAVRYTPQTTLRIGFYPRDICADFYLAGGDAVGCTSGIVTLPTAILSPSMQLSFAVTQVADATSYPPTTTTPTPTPGVTPTPGIQVGKVIDQTTAPVSFTFENIIPSLACPPEATLNNSVIPGDKQIFLDTTGFGFATPNSAAGAPGAALVVVGQDTNATDTVLPDVTMDYAKKNSMNSRIGLGNAMTPVPGFKNSLPDDIHAYRVSFIGQDRAGLYIAPALVDNCKLFPVEVSAVQGFLNKSNCFIATAAFGSIDAAPVTLLREFRDSILLPSALGQSFVHWYYSWSPPAAEWLLFHPVFRLPVLLFLSPLEAIAWLYLHPQWAYLLMGGLFLFFAFLGGHELLKRGKGLHDGS